MVKIKCPNCGQQIELDKSSYNELLNDIASNEVDKRVQEQTKAIQESYNAKLALEQQKAQAAQEKEINELKQKNASLEAKFKADLALQQAEDKAKSDKELANLRAELVKLQEQLKNTDSKTELEVAKAVKEINDKLSLKEQEIVKLNGEIKENKSSFELEKSALAKQHEFELKAKDEEIEKWKNFRMGDSTKDIGESLEKYCSDAFNEVRSYAYPRADFKKDNEVDEEGKGDFIFRDFAEDGTEIVSIMFEMKNQKDTTKTKQKNEHFFDKLDKNRTSKGCEYAVLVSTLEEDSKLYNNGIVDVSYQYPKMFVIRPQHFLGIIGLIRNLALNNVKYKQALTAYQQENADITNFEAAVAAVAKKINDDYDNAGKQYDKVEKMCDDMIKKLQDLKETFRLGQKWLGAAQNQLPNLEIRKLTNNNPTMKAKFDDLKKK